jgi:TolA-binding protein
MSTLTPTRKVSRRHELREDKVITFSARILGFIEENRSMAYAIFGGIILIVAMSLYYSYDQSNKNTLATAEMAQAVGRYEAADYAAALDGDISFKGLVEIADEYGSTDAGNLARFYAADALFKTGNLDRALLMFQDFRKDANYLGASALAGEAAIHESKGDFETAAGLYLRSANLFSSRNVAPEYLLNAGNAYEKAGETEAARRAYEQLKTEYPDTPQARDIEFYIGRVTAASQE